MSLIYALLEILQPKLIYRSMTKINLISWFTFIIFVSLFQELTQSQYILYSSFMFIFSCFYDYRSSVKISLKKSLLIFTLPNILFLYLIFVYNNFLSLTPVKPEIFLSISFFYVYILIYSTRQFKNHLK